MAIRPRIDLDGVALCDPSGRTTGTLAVFRRRTVKGIVLLMPESGDFAVPWDDIEDASLDLQTGEVQIRFTAGYAAKQNWLGNAESLTGIWIDRSILQS